MGFAVILSSRWGKAGLWVDFRGSSFDGPSGSKIQFGQRWTNVVVLRTAIISGGAAGDSGRCHTRTGSPVPRSSVRLWILEHTQQRQLRTICEPFKSATCAPMSGQKRFGSDIRRLC